MARSIPKHKRKPLKEVFKTMLVTIGSVNVEMFNDSEGDKDRGPNYGLRMYIDFSPSTGRRTSSIFDYFPLRYL
jgi:hypothetical protein